MLIELSNILDRGRVSEDDMQNATRLLLRRQFIYHGDHGIARGYEIIRDHETYFSNLVGALGYRLFIDARRTVAGIVPVMPGRKVGIEETLLLLALRLAYEKGCDSLTLGSDDEVSIDAADVLEHYPQFGGRAAPTLPQMRNLLSSFAKLRFVLLEDNGSDALTVVIRPEIRQVTGPMFLSRVEAFAGITAEATAAEATPSIVSDDAADDGMHVTDSADVSQENAS